MFINLYNFKIAFVCFLLFADYICMYTYLLCIFEMSMQITFHALYNLVYDLSDRHYNWRNTLYVRGPNTLWVRVGTLGMHFVSFILFYISSRDRSCGNWHCCKRRDRNYGFRILLANMCKIRNSKSSPSKNDKR